MCGDRRSGPAAVYFGTLGPTHVMLTPGQILAIGALDGCSATLIADRWALTAEHCGVSVGRSFCMTTRGDRSDERCVRITRVIDHPSRDTTLLELAASASASMPGVEPIPVASAPLGRAWIGRRAEGAGFGRQEDRGFGEREFTAQPIVDVDSEFISVDGEGMRGLCFGDSGGPLMIIADDGTTRLVGDLTGGDASCVGVDDYTRIDDVRDWIESHTGPLAEPGAGGCGPVTIEGACRDGAAVWCEGTTVRTQACAAGQVCGLDPGAGGYRCVAVDPCMGLDSAGRCEGDVATWCEGATVRRRECGACGQRCAPSVRAWGGGAYCVD